MYYRLFKEQEKFLLSQPESGMGYQIIEAIQRGSALPETYIVLNAELAIPLKTGYEDTIKNIVRDGFSKALLKSQLIFFSSFKFLSESTVQEPSGAAIDNPRFNGKKWLVKTSECQSE